MSERRVFVLFVLVVLGQLVLLTAQIPSRSGSGSTLDTVTLALLAPPARVVSSAIDGVAQLRRRLRTMASLQGENQALREEIRQLQLEQVRRYGLELQLDNLTQALDYSPPPAGEVAVADVVYVDHASWLRTLIIYLPDPSPRRLHASPVTTAGGLVGRMLGRQGSYGRVQLVTDRASSIGVMIERTRRQGIVRGADDGLMLLDYVPLQADVQVGDRVVTAGIDGVYPQGIAVGLVIAVEPGGDLFHRIRVQPAVDFGQLHQVYVLLREAVPNELKGSGTSASP